MEESNSSSASIAVAQPSQDSTAPLASTSAVPIEAMSVEVPPQATTTSNEVASESNSYVGSSFAPFPEQSPLALPLTGFQSIPSRAAVLPNAKPYTQPPPYDTPNVQLGAGLSTEPPVRRIIDDAEEGKMRVEEARSPGVVREEEVAKFSVAELKKMGLGRVPSGKYFRY